MRTPMAWRVLSGMALVLSGMASVVEAGEAQPSPRVEPYHPAWKVAARSLVLPGWGQFHLGEPGPGQAYLAGAVLGGILAFEVVSFAESDNSRQAMKAAGWGIYGVSTLLSVSAAWQSAERRNRENGWELGLLSLPAGGTALGIRASF